VSLRYPERLVKKIDQNPPVGYVKVTLGNFWSEKLLDSTGFFSSMMSVVTQWLILFPFKCSCVLILISLWHHKNFIKKNDQKSLLVSPLRAFNVHSGYGGWKSCHFFVSFSIVCHEWWHNLDLLFDATQCKCSTLIILLVIHTYLQKSSNYYYYWLTFGNLLEIWATPRQQVIVNFGAWGCTPNPYSSHINVIYIRCLTTFICCGCAYGCVPTTLWLLMPT
jgi:hypothetical protein